MTGSPRAVPIVRLGEPRFPSPLGRERGIETPEKFVTDESLIPHTLALPGGKPRADQMWFEEAGPRERIYFNPSETAAAVVTCGGLCPGLNDVVRSLVLELHYGYGVRRILGIRYGYQGMNPANGQAPLELTPAMVSGIHKLGGTVLGTSRGPVDPKIMVEFLRERGVGILFPIGGDGTQRGALAIFEEARRQGHELAVVGIPKTIDNDILYVSRTFGYLTAIGEARQVIDSAHTEARGVFNGIGLVRLMGRHSGFIAAGAALASGDVNFVLIPEVPFRLEGEHGFLNVLEKRLAAKSHAVVVVAEGAGQELIERRTAERDASGNERLADIGVFLRERIVEYFGQRRIPVNVRYIDPSYVIRSKPVSSDDAILCDWLARGAAHAGMAGKTGLVIGFLHGATLHVPMEMVAAGRQHVDPGGPAWRSVLASTGQPARFE